MSPVALTPAGQIEDANTSASSTGDVSGTRYYTFGGATVAVRTSDGNLALVLGESQGSVSVTMPVTLTASGAMASATVADAQAATRTSYTPYGQLRGDGGEDDDNLALDRGWLGQVEDRADAATGTGTGLTYLNARYYDPVLARFITPDPLMNPADPKTLDPYRYADNNPVVFTDANGLAPLKNMMIEGWSGSGGSSTVKATRATTQAAAVSTRKQFPAIQAQHRRDMAAIGTPTQAFWKTTPDTWLTGAQGAVNFLGGALNGGISMVNGGLATSGGSMAYQALTGKSAPQIPTVGIWGDYDTFKYSSWLGTGVFTAATFLVGGGGVGVGSAGARAAVGAEGAATGIGGAANVTSAGSSGLVNLFRAVGVREFQSVMATGRFEPAANSLNARQFATSLDEAIQYADMDLSKVAVIQTTVERSVLEGLDFSRTIDPFIFRNGVFTVQPGAQSEAFHAAIVAVAHVF